MAWLILLGEYLIAIPFLIPLLQELDPIFGKKEKSKEYLKKELQRQLTEVFSPLHYVDDANLVRKLILKTGQRIKLLMWFWFQ